VTSSWSFILQPRQLYWQPGVHKSRTSGRRGDYIFYFGA